MKHFVDGFMQKMAASGVPESEALVMFKLAMLSAQMRARPGFADAVERYVEKCAPPGVAQRLSEVPLRPVEAPGVGGSVR